MQEIELNKILAQVGRTVIQQPKTVEIDIKPKNWFQKLLMKKGFLKSKKVFEIGPVLVGNRYRVAIRSLNIPVGLFTADYDEVEIMQAIANHTEDLIYVVGVCIQNNSKEPSKALLDYLKWIDDSKFYELLDASLSMLGTTSFMKSTILIKGQNVISAKDSGVSTVTIPE
jgi:hypothetical protein